ncbi:hypothetical protein R1flu_001792 [Riccia fluitans]|uniref:Uncharacterized protein n=1 Tax=Riccia fluitans TaxID=41844 RepID=A0ABD1Y7M3_9MARC
MRVADPADSVRCDGNRSAKRGCLATWETRPGSVHAAFLSRRIRYVPGVSPCVRLTTSEGTSPWLEYLNAVLVDPYRSSTKVVTAYPGMLYLVVRDGLQRGHLGWWKGTR